MSSVLRITLNIPADGDNRSRFYSWVQQRQYYVHNLGSRLLLLTEAELTACFESWEKYAKDQENSDRLYNIMLALLHISILHYFTRSFDQIKSFVNFLRRQLESKNTTLVMCSAKSFSWLADESQECVDFLRENILIASELLSSPMTVFSALSILRRCGKFVLPTVFEETSRTFDLIWSYVTSDDIDMQFVAAKLVKYHLRGLKANSSMPSTIFDNCIARICDYDKIHNKSHTTKKVDLLSRNKYDSRSLYGVTLVLGYILRQYKNQNQAVTVNNLIDQFPYASYEQLSYVFFSIQLYIAQDSQLSYVITPDTAPKVLNALFTAAKKFSSVRLYEILRNYFSYLNLETYRSFLGDAIDYLSESVQDKKNIGISEKSFEILIVIMQKFNNIKIPPSLFLNAEISEQYLTTLSKTMSIFSIVKPTLKQKLDEGFSPKATVQQQILSLRIFRKFSNHLFDNVEVMFDSIQKLSKSPNDEVRLLVVSVLHFFNNRKSSDIILFLALFDPSKVVRAAAVEQLTDVKHLDQAKMLPQILTDRSYKVRRNSISLIEGVAPKNPMLFYVPITSFVQQTILSMFTTSSPSKCQKISTLIPLIAKHLVNFCPAYIPQIVKVCYIFLSSKIEDKESSILSIIQRDMNNSKNTLIASTHPFDPSCINLNQLYNIENKIVIDKRDANLFETLKYLASHLDPFLDELLPVYITVLSEKRSPRVYLSALSSLIEIANKLPQASQIPLKQPKLPRVLIRLLRKKPSEEVSIMILKLMATFGITSYPRSYGQVFDGIDEDEFDFKSPSYFTDSIMSELIKLLYQNHMCVFEAITSIFIEEANYAVKFIAPIIKAYADALKTTKPNLKQVLFNQLEIISYYCGIKMEPYSPILAELILQNIQLKEALRLACVLSYHLKTEFIPISPPLFMECIRKLALKSTCITQELVDFLTYSIIYQNQPFDAFIEAAEERFLLKPSTEDINKLILAITTIVQLYDVSFESSRIARICIPLLTTPARPNVVKLLFSLVFYCQLSVEFIEWLVPEESSKLQALKNYKEGKISSTDEFIPHAEIKVTVQIPPYFPMGNKLIVSLFDSFQAPPSNTEKWLEDLCNQVIQCSPQISVRACYKTALTLPEFRIAIFPVAFLSCWQHVPSSHQNKFSNTMKEILSDKTQKPDQVFLTLAEMLSRAGCPFSISEFDLAKACTSPLQGLRFCVRYFQENPRDTKAIEMLLELNTHLGRISTAKGLLNNVDLPSLGNWSETLGEWDDALEIYEKNMDENLPAILRCYAKLERWDDIRALSDRFQSLSPQQKNDAALWCAWASLKKNNFNDVSSFMVYLHDNKDYDICLFRLIYYVHCNMYDKAREEIEKDMKYLVSDCSAYTSINASQADRNLVYANHFTELAEVIDQKTGVSGEKTDIWNRRLNYITGDGYSWMRICEIRSLICSPTVNEESYLKLLSVLMKERKWDLVDSFQPIVMDRIDNTAVQIIYVKILWARGRSSEAIESVKFLNFLHNSKTYKEFSDSVASISPDIIKKVATSVSACEGNTDISLENLFNHARNPFQANKITPEQRAKMIRLEASWSANVSEDLNSSIKKFEESSMIDPSEYKTWANWAYTSVKAINENDSNKDKYVEMAINGFLRASELHQSNTLEYLCNLFSLFFRYASTTSIQSDLLVKISQLKPEIIERMLPQVVCQIAHSDEKVRSVLHALIVNFSVKHYQAIVFQLQLIADGDEGEKSTTAKDLLAKISLPHQELAHEAKIFADGLIKSAVTVFDILYTNIDEAYQLELAGEHEKSINKLKVLTKLRSSAKSQLGISQIKSIGQKYNTFVDLVNKNPRTQQAINKMWDATKALFQLVRDRIKKLDVIQLETVSEELTKKRNFHLSVPGTYSTTDPGPHIVAIDPTLPILSTQQHPRIVYMHGSDGKKWKLLLKGNEDLRLDQRIMQFFDLINTLIKSKRLNYKNVTIINYPITPLSPIAGLISWVTGADTLQQLVTENRKANGILPSIESEMLNAYTGSYSPYLQGIQKLEMWGKIAPKCPATDLRDVFWMKCQNPVQWLQCVDTFSISTALMSISGYVIGLGDRHPSNIMIQRKQGHVVHIDFGDSFEVTLNRKKMPEKVPFRLTRMITNALGVAGTEGIFKTTCENILYILRKNKSSIIAQLEIFIHEPTFAPRDETENIQTIMQRINMKLNGLDPAIEKGTEVTEELSIEEQTRRLISIASDHTRYIMHYDGWCPYW